MKRKVGFTALILAGIFFLLALAASLSLSVGLYAFTMAMFWGCGITATICLFGDFIRYIGKMFAMGWSEAAEKSYSRYCPQCGKGLEQDAHFCPGCGTELN